MSILCDFGVLSVAQYCSHLGIIKKFDLLPAEKEYIRDKVLKSGPNKICGRQPLKNLKGYGR